jgi:hypothetical protein
MTDERDVAEELIAAMSEALAIARGELQPATVHQLELVPDVDARPAYQTRPVRCGPT